MRVLEAFRSHPNTATLFRRRNRQIASFPLRGAALLVLSFWLSALGLAMKSPLGQESGPAANPAEQTARIQGQVTDPTGAAIPGVLLTLTRLPDGPTSQTLSNDLGRFQFDGLRPGKYRLSAELTGFRTLRRIVTLKPGETRTLAARLEIGDVSETVTVSAEALPFETQSATLTTTVRFAKEQRFSADLGAYDDWRYNPDFNTEAYAHFDENPFIRVSEDPRSTFSIDVDTASYANVRRFLSRGMLPPKDAVRIEELVNYFEYEHPSPVGEEPFAVSLQTASAPWNPAHRLMAIGIQGRPVDHRNRPPGNFVFLIDVSGSMRSPDKLPLLVQGLRFLVEQLGERDRVAIVVYAGSSGLVLPSTPGFRQAEILEALEGLEAGGSTNGGEGIRLAYDVAVQNFLEGGVNRVVLATDGDFNVGVTNQGDLVRLIEEQASKGVFLTVLGFGTGNLKDSTMEKLADRGNGNYSYIDSLLEARKVLVEEMGATLVTIAKDVKIQVEFNPLEVEAFRLLGYENRLLEHRDFQDDRKDAGEIGAGHSLTALYEIVPAGQSLDASRTAPLRYQSTTNPTPQAFSGELLLLRLRYKEPDSDRSRLLEATVFDDGRAFSQASDGFRFAAAVAAFGMLLRESPHKGTATFEQVLSWARESLGPDPGGYRQDFLELVLAARDCSAVR